METRFKEGDKVRFTAMEHHEMVANETEHIGKTGTVTAIQDWGTAYSYIVTLDDDDETEILLNEHNVEPMVTQ